MYYHELKYFLTKELSIQYIKNKFKEKKWYIKEKLAELKKNFMCLKTRLRMYAMKHRKKKPHYGNYDHHYGKREIINSMDDCFDFMSEPLYGFRTLLSTQKFCFGNDLDCLQSPSTRNFQKRQTEDFESESPPDCRVSLMAGAQCQP